MSNYVNDNGVSEMWTNTKNYISAQLLGKSNVGHTHSASDVTSGLSTVATSGSYNDLSNKPTIPSKTSDLTNDSSFITSDNTKIPLAGSNQISGDLIPSTTDTVNLGSLNNVYNITYSRVLSSGSDTSKYMALYSGGKQWGGGSALILYAKRCTLDGMSGGEFALAALNATDYTRLIGSPNGTLIWEGNVIRPATDNGCDLGSSQYQWNNAYIKSLTVNGTAAGDILTHNASEFIPRSGGAVMTGDSLARTVNNRYLQLLGGTGWGKGGIIYIYGKDESSYASTRAGAVQIRVDNGSNAKEMLLYPDGTWTWTGTAVQLISDQRLKQQIAEIDDKLLDAWEDVTLVQFKYNDAVDEKGDKARLHTGYVVQQIDKACKEHGVDISAYGLFCHEEYPEETEEVEVEQKDGTKTKERKVIREANEHYSLRYTEALIVECAYLRKCIKELRNEIEELKSSK